MVSSIAVKANQNVLDAEKLEHFEQLLAGALDLEVEVLQGCDVTTRDIFHAVPKTRRAEYISHREHMTHTEALCQMNILKRKPVDDETVYVTGW